MRRRRVKFVAPNTYTELLRWREQGLITFSDSDSFDDVLSRVLRVLRKELLSYDVVDEDSER